MEGSGYYANVGIPLSSGVFSRVLLIIVLYTYLLALTPLFNLTWCRERADVSNFILIQQGGPIQLHLFSKHLLLLHVGVPKSLLLWFRKVRRGSMCLNHPELVHKHPAHRTFSNHIITEIARCVEFCHMSSGWFDHTEPSLSGVEGAYAPVRGVSSSSNLVEPFRTTSLQR